MQSHSSPPLRNLCDRRVTCNDPAMSKGRRFTFGPAASASPTLNFDFWLAVRLVMYMLTTLPGRARLTGAQWKHGVNEGAKGTTKSTPYFFCTHDKAPKSSPHTVTAHID